MKKKNRLIKSDRIWLLSAGLLVLLQFWWLPGAPGTPDDTFSHSFAGKRGLFETLQKLSGSGFFPEVIRETERLIPQQSGTLLILGPDRYPNEYEIIELTKYVQNGGHVLFAPNWTEPDCRIPGLNIRTKEGALSELETTVPPPAILKPEADKENSESINLEIDLAESETDPESDTTEGPVGGTPGLSPASTPTPTGNRVINDGAIRTEDFSVVAIRTSLMSGSVEWRTKARLELSALPRDVLVRSHGGMVQAVIWNHGRGKVLLSASPDVFSNRAMLHEPQAELAIRLIARLHSEHMRPDSTPIIVSEFLNTSGAYRGTGVLMSPSLRSGTLQLILIAVLVGWFGFHRFGPARRDTATQRRSLTESAAAVGNLFFRTQSGGEAVSCYLEYVRTHVQALFGSTTRLEDSKKIAVRSGLDPGEVRRRIDQAIVLSGAPTTTAPQAASAIRDLSDLMGRLSGPGRRRSR